MFLDPMAYVPSRLFLRDSGVSCEGVCLWNGEVFDWLYDGDQLDQYAKRILPRLISEGWEVYEKWGKAAQAFQAVHDDVMKLDPTSLTDEQLFELMEKYFNFFTEQYTLNNWIEPVSHYFQNALQKLLEETGTNTEIAKQAIQDFGHPLKKSYVKRCLEEYAAAKTPDQVKTVVEKYYYLTNDFTGPHPLTEEGIKAISAKQEKHTPPSLDSFNPQTQGLLRALQLTTTVQDVRKEFILKWVSGADRLLWDVARRLQRDHDLLRFATWVELMHHNVPSDAELTERSKACVIEWSAKGTECVSGPEAQKLYTEFKRVVIGSDNVTSLKGMPASKGKIIGRAVVVLHPSQFSEVKPGDILVTVMTRPEYLPVMSVAAAFVTDEGGITSHAAIVAREMKKPCVIATKKASKVIQTGQQIEVDADTGTVTIL